MRIVIVALLFVAAVGCANNQPARTSEPVPSYTPRVELKVEVTPEWRQFVLQNYKELIRNEVITPATTQFPADPEITAVRFDERTLVLRANGKADTQNRFGAMIRFPYSIQWQMNGVGRWELQLALVMDR